MPGNAPSQTLTSLEDAGGLTMCYVQTFHNFHATFILNQNFLKDIMFTIKDLNFLAKVAISS